jgi:hypothetical protein
MLAKSVQNGDPSARPIAHLNQIELARRWKMSSRTLERWRWLALGPPHLKIGGRVLYRLDDVEVYEARQVRTRTPGLARDRVRKCTPGKRT